MIDQGSLASPEFHDLLYNSLLNSRKEISSLTNDMKKQYNKAWGNSEWLEKRLARGLAQIMINNMLDILQEIELSGVQEAGPDQSEPEG